MILFQSNDRDCLTVSIVLFCSPSNNIGYIRDYENPNRSSSLCFQLIIYVFVVLAHVPRSNTT